MSEIGEKIIANLKTISEDAKNSFGELSLEQINWRPSGDGWSVGQCFEHLIIANEMFYGELDKIADGTRRNSTLEKLSPLSGFFGNLMIKSLKKDERKYKAPSKNILPPSEIDPNIIELFAAHQAEMIGKIELTSNADCRKTIVTSPFMKFMTYRLEDGFNIIVEHERRHLRQAERVKQNENFPQ